MVYSNLIASERLSHSRNADLPRRSNTDDVTETEVCNFEDLFDSSNKPGIFNPLDIITALFLCSDGFVQQELALKMSMCQFSVPLLLPNCDTKQCTLMLWAIRDIVKKYRPSDLSESKGFIEERIVTSELPMVSFVRLGECSMSKSEILNKLLSNSQQYHDTFVHCDMECGDTPRRISNGLAEITWYLPCGNKNMDIFSEPVAIANLRGDIASFETQFSFLWQTSAAVFVLFDQPDSKWELLTDPKCKAKIYLVGKQNSKGLTPDGLKKIANMLSLNKSRILIKRKQTNDADFVTELKNAVSNVLSNTKHKISVEQMAGIADKLGIEVDEDSPECQDGKEKADAITAEIKDTFKYKEEQFPLQGKIWKELTFLEKEQFRLREVGSENIEDYITKLKKKKEEKRQKQNSYAMSGVMARFITAISSPEKERGYFLKWMRMNLDNLSRVKLSGLREKYKEKYRDSDNKNEIKEIDQQLSNSSLGVEHFFREMGQIYEASLYLPETDPSRQQLLNLPKLCAQLLLDGFPLELVDGDASNIPLRWVREVLYQLNDFVSPKNKIVVVTVLGVQSTGKSTLLNTMFGVQFAVSSGRCTRGAFMLLIKLLLDQLNEMTQAAAKMEKREKNKKFTDVMEYNPDTGNCYIPGLWNGNPPMAPVNAGYSEAVYDLKKNIIQLLGKCGSTSNNILEFREWITSLWKAVKHENFIFSFRNSLVADAYMRLCTEYNKWEWAFKKEMYTWVTNAETKISNFGTVAATSDIFDMENFITELESEAVTELMKLESIILENLKKYFEQPEGHVHLVERYREDFSNSIKSLRAQTESSVSNQLRVAADLKKGKQRLDKIKTSYTEEIGKAVCELIDECRKKKVEMTDSELDVSFDEMWIKTLKTLSFAAQQTSDIYANIYRQLLTNISPKGSHACELLNKKSLKDCGLKPFEYTPKGVRENMKVALKGLWSWKDIVKERQKNADSIIADCSEFVSRKIENKTNYHDTYIQEILHIIDEKLNNDDVNSDIKFEVSLKQHICGSAARKFQKMHEDFIRENDPQTCLQENKEKFCTDFKDVFYQCQKKAEEFTNQCLKPAVENFVYRSLGSDIVDKILTKIEFSTRMSFQYMVLLDLIEKNNFESFQRYILSYEEYVKKWIIERIEEKFSSEFSISELEDIRLRSCTEDINIAIKNAKAEKTDSLKTFVENICKELGDKLVISQDALNAFMVLNKADQEQFTHWLRECVKEMKEALREKFKNTDFDATLRHLHLKPQDELFRRVVGCGKQCPFCKIPCDAGGKAHSEHFASLHRPNGLGQYRSMFSRKLCTDICSSLVISDKTFSCTEIALQPYKEYRKIFPDWNIPPDSSLKASEYWKYVMNKYNMKFAEAYVAKPADIPDDWGEITVDQAKDSLKKYNGK
ncbi:PREDICTED: interferon-induced very large GTPase 1-like [Cyprinodon variegatus]|uniref:interferon-induced very large GTPase 1-like n=1 Tax=Cyprinodon variegatus TaxID=28743 RepID=UPI0007428F9B|nr:PREDICTED: interferon-induced very large GTPase 1-like [Cyprinodon variegatus]